MEGSILSNGGAKTVCFDPHLFDTSMNAQNCV